MNSEMNDELYSSTCPLVEMNNELYSSTYPLVKLYIIIHLQDLSLRDN